MTRRQSERRRCVGLAPAAVLAQEQVPVPVLVLVLVPVLVLALVLVRCCCRCLVIRVTVSCEQQAPSHWHERSGWQLAIEAG